MQGIKNIIDSGASLGFKWFYGDLLNQGYLRRMLQTNPSLESIYAQLKDDIEFVNEADEYILASKRQLKAFKTMKSYLIDAKRYVKTQITKKKERLESEQKEIDDEIRSLDKDLRNDLIDKEEYEHAKNMLLKVPADDLSDVKSRFEAIDHKVRQELKKFGYEEEDSEEDKDDENFILPENEPFESKEFDINKLMDEKNRRYTMEEFNDIYEDIQQVEEAVVNAKQQEVAQQKQALAISTMVKQYEQRKKAANRNPQQTAADKKNNAAKLQQLGVDPKLIAQLQADDKL